MSHWSTQPQPVIQHCEAQVRVFLLGVSDKLILKYNAAVEPVERAPRPRGSSVPIGRSISFHFLKVLTARELKLHTSPTSFIQIGQVARVKRPATWQERGGGPNFKSGTHYKQSLRLSDINTPPHPTVLTLRSTDRSAALGVTTDAGRAPHLRVCYHCTHTLHERNHPHIPPVPDSSGVAPLPASGGFRSACPS